MGTITYTAQRSLVSGHVAGEECLFLIDFTDETQRSAATEKAVNRALGGAMEVIRYRSDVNWNVVTQPLNGDKLLQLREFLDSTDGGELFTVDFWGTTSRTVKRTDSGYSETPFSRVGEETKDFVQVSFSVIEV